MTAGQAAPLGMSGDVEHELRMTISTMDESELRALLAKLRAALDEPSPAVELH